MYYIQFSLYHLVIPPPLIPPIPLVFTSCSKGPWHLLGAPYIPSASFILIFVRGPRLASLANWSRLADPCFFAIPFWPFWTLSGPSVPVRVRKNTYLARHSISHLALSLPLDFSVMDSFPLISPSWISSPWGRSSGYTIHSQSLYRSHTPFQFLMYLYQVCLFPFIHWTSCTLCSLSSFSGLHDSLNFFFIFVYYPFCPQLVHDMYH